MPEKQERQERLVHPIPPVYDETSRVLILGSFPSVKSRQAQFFYGHPQNRFWTLMAQLFEEARPEGTEEKRAFLLRHHLAVWDVIHSCEITGSSDASIRNVIVNDLRPILERADIRRIFVNGKTAEKLYRKYILPRIGRDCAALPSTSPANAAWNLEKLGRAWRMVREIAESSPKELENSPGKEYNKHILHDSQSVKEAEMGQTTVAFTGDIGFDRYMDGRFRDPHLVSQEILDFFHSSDHVLANVEGALIDQSEAVDGGGKGRFFHTMDPGAVNFLKLIHADIWNFANNHTMDSGEKGVLNGRKLAAENGVRTIGAGANLQEAAEPVFLEEAGGIGFIGMGYQPGCVAATATSAGCLPNNDWETIGKAIRRVKESCRWCVIVVHAGEEFTALPAPYTRDMYLRYLEEGADIVVAHHPHVPNHYELLPGKAIFYSLGNFVFDTDYQRNEKHTDEAVLLKIRFTENDFSFEPLPVHINRETASVEVGTLPPIFTNIPAEEYEKLKYMGAKAFLANERRRMRFLKPAEYAEADEAAWEAYYRDMNASGRIKNEHNDMACYADLAAQADNGAFEESKMEAVKEYILDMIRTEKSW